MKKLLSMAVVLAAFVFSPLYAASDGPPGCQEGNCFNGYGKYKYANGNLYIGDFREGKPNGRGILYCANGNKYLGDWQDSWRQGRGKFIFKEGHEYTGGFYRNNFHGKGIMQYANGDRYDGNWRNNLPNGQGIYYFKTGKRYKGGFLNGRFHGRGTLYYKDGSLFEGNWLRSKKHGPGTFTDANGTVYRDEWVNGRPLRNEVSKTEEEETLIVRPVADKQLEEESPLPPVREPVWDSEEKSSIRIWATVIGVAAYSHMPSLRYTDDDAYLFYAFLKSPEGGALPDEQVKVLVDDNATRENILQAMRATFLRADENDMVLFYFSGHGVEGAFIPADFDGFSNRLYHHEVRQILDASKAKYKLVVGDACHAGSLYGLNDSENLLASRSFLPDMLNRYYGALSRADGGLALLMSSKQEEVSLEDSGLRSGVFSHFLIKGLKGAADYNNDGIVTIEEAYKYTSQEVSGYTAGAQTPILTGTFDEKMPFSVVRR